MRLAAPLLPKTVATLLHRGRCRYSSSWANKAQITRAFLLAKATAATLVPFAVFERAQPPPCASVRRSALLPTRAPHESAASAHTDCRVFESHLSAFLASTEYCRAPDPTRPPDPSFVKRLGPTDGRHSAVAVNGPIPGTAAVSGRPDVPGTPGSTRCVTRSMRDSSSVSCSYNSEKVLGHASIPTPRHPESDEGLAVPLRDCAITNPYSDQQSPESDS